MSISTNNFFDGIMENDSIQNSNTNLKYFSFLLGKITVAKLISYARKPQKSLVWAVNPYPS